MNSLWYTLHPIAAETIKNKHSAGHAHHSSKIEGRTMGPTSISWLFFKTFAKSSALNEKGTSNLSFSRKGVIMLFWMSTPMSRFIKNALGRLCIPTPCIMAPVVFSLYTICNFVAEFKIRQCKKSNDIKLFSDERQIIWFKCPHLRKEL